MSLATLAIMAIPAAALAALYLAARRAITVAELHVERGVVRVVRGGIAPPVLADLRDVAERPRIERLRIRIVRASGRAEVHLHGRVAEAQAQRIRNVVGSVPMPGVSSPSARTPCHASPGPRRKPSRSASVRSR